MAKGLVIVVLSPSGGGKGTILKEVFASSKNMKLSVSATTRKPRPGEKHGEHYFFVTHEEFEKMIADGEMLEYAEYCGNYYGTPKSPVEKWTNDGQDVILEIEIQGGQQVKKLLPDCISVFIVPPSMSVLEKRLRNRGTETDDVIKGRLEVARKEVAHAKDYDYVVVNDKLEDAVSDIKSIIRAEKLKYYRNEGIIERVLEDA